MQSPEDVIELLAGFATPRSTFRETAPPLALTDEAPIADSDPTEIAALLTSAPVAVDELIRQSGESALAVQLVLLN